MNFGCILNDTEVTRYVNITNNSPQEVKYKWSFVLEEGVPVTTFHTRLTLPQPQVCLFVHTIGCMIMKNICLHCKGLFTLIDCKDECENFLWCFALLDVNSSIEINKTLLFATSFLKLHLLSVNGP